MPRPKKNSLENRLIGVTEKILVEEYNPQLRTKFFHWNDGIKNRIKSVYGDQHGPISSGDMKIINEMMNNKAWRSTRTSSARAKNNIGIVQEHVGSARVGEVSTAGRKTAAYAAAQNAQDGRGVQVSVDLPLDEFGLIIDCLLDIQSHETPKELPPHLSHLFLKDADDSVLRDVISKQFEMVQEILLVETGNNMGMTAKQIFQSKHKIDKLIQKVVKKRKRNFQKCEDPQLARQQETDLRTYTVLSIRELLIGEEALLGQGHVLLLPVIFTLSNGKELRFPAVATMGFKNEKGEVELDRKICPGMSNSHYGGQSDNDQPIILDGNTIAIPSLGMYFNTNAAKDASSKIKIAKDRDSGEYATSPIVVKGNNQLARKIYPSVEEKGSTIKYQQHSIALPVIKRSKQPGRGAKKTKTETVTTKTISQHRLNNMFTFHIGTHGNDAETNALLEEKNASCLEALYLPTGENEIDYDDMLDRHGLTQEVVDSWSENAEREKVPQGQCDNDHCCHRNHPICNSHYAALPMSHTANRINSVIRRVCGDWCYGLSIHAYKDGR